MMGIKLKSAERRRRSLTLIYAGFDTCTCSMNAVALSRSDICDKCVASLQAWWQYRTSFSGRRVYSGYAGVGFFI